MALQPQKPRPKYRCTQLELYEVCRIGLDSYIENRPAFTAFKPKYTNAWGNQFKTQINSAEALPDLQARTEPSEVGRLKLALKGEQCLTAWQRLKRHIADVQGWENLQKPKLEAAGSDLYEAAASSNWESMIGLMKSGDEFIAKNLTDLKANGNMPPAFQGSFSTLRTQFNSLYEDFGDAEQDQEEATAEKINSNNSIYDKLISMFLDGQEIFRKDKAKQDRFIFDSVLKIVRGSKGVTKTFTIEPQSRQVVNRVVASSNIENTGPVTLWLAAGDVDSQPAGATQLDPEATIPVFAGVSTITIFNNDADTSGKAQVRVTID